MRILHIAPDYAPTVGGAELYVKEISERLVRRQHEVTVIALDSRGASEPVDVRLHGKEVINGVHVHRLSNTYRLHCRFFRMRGAYRALSLMLDTARYEMFAISPVSLRAFLHTLLAGVDVVAVANWYHGSLVYQTAIARHVGRFAFVGIPFFHTERSWAHSGLLAQMLGRCDAVAAMTEHERRFIEARSSQRNVHVVGAGVDDRLFLGADGRRIRSGYGVGDAPLVGYVGRISAGKGVVTLLRAMKIVWQHDPGVRLLLAGSGLPSSPACEDEVRAEFAKLSEAERGRIVAIPSFTDAEKPDIYAALDVFVMTSVAESFGIAYLEAWMCGKAVVGASAGSTVHVIDDNVDGRLVAPGDSEALARCLTTLLSDPQTRERLGRAGRAKSLAAFTWDRVADKIEQAYASARVEASARRGTTAVE